ncbi:DUF2335 domain-containing protein [Cupriavidus sp. CV2]|uniref:DUF2335 domain-containing protein n=1 Tax=Cupriavidus ulmosensis TaxID=3065913 RepID=UPI00296B53CB|nr:DUF2335 domain-containing protein [Cupriavidus sp. CV2]MDW3683074.1 DUF2335 domain-containing protein [Cupriavidus sp. CV2]
MPRSKNTRKQRVPARQVAPQPNPQIIHATQTKLHTGPIPAPDVLHDYNVLVPGSAERIIAMAEQQAKHRQELESRSLEGDISARDRQIEVEHGRIQGIILNERLGQLLGWSVGAGCVAAAIYCIVGGYGTIAAGLFMSIPVGGIINAIRQPTAKRPPP